jgi:hypothetical protein
LILIFVQIINMLHLKLFEIFKGHIKNVQIKKKEIAQKRKKGKEKKDTTSPAQHLVWGVAFASGLSSRSAYRGSRTWARGVAVVCGAATLGCEGS